MKVKFGSIRYNLFFVLFCFCALGGVQENKTAVISKAVHHAVLLAVSMNSFNSLTRISS